MPKMLQSLHPQFNCTLNKTYSRNKISSQFSVKSAYSISKRDATYDLDTPTGSNFHSTVLKGPLK